MKEFLVPRLSTTSASTMLIFISLYFSLSHLHIHLIREKLSSSEKRANLCSPGIWACKEMAWIILYGTWCWMATSQGLKPDLKFSNPRLTWVREVPGITKAVCDSGPPGIDRVSALKPALWYWKVTLFRKGKKTATFPPHVRQDLFYHLGCRWELLSSPLLHRDNASVQLSSC